MSKNRPKVWFDDKHNVYSYKSDVKPFNWRGKIIYPVARKYCKHWGDLSVGQKVKVEYHSKYSIWRPWIEGTIKRIDLNYGELPEQLIIRAGNGLIYHVDLTLGDKVFNIGDNICYEEKEHSL